MLVWNAEQEEMKINALIYRNYLISPCAGKHSWFSMCPCLR